MDHQDITSPFLPLPDGIVITTLEATPASLVVQIACRCPIASCPLCQMPSDRIHGCYERMVADVPCGGRRVTLALTVRKFVCRTPTCLRKIFTERLPDLVRSYARMTNRLRAALQALGFATSGEGSERLAPKLGMHVTGPTMLRHMRTMCAPPVAPVRFLGIDDWAWKKGQTYGTILVDLELRRPIDLLPDRSAATLERWLHTHPEVEVVSRDRASAYADAVQQGAPQATQVADKFHILKNLREKLKALMARKQSCLPEVERETSDAIPQKARGRLPSSTEPETCPPEGKSFRMMSPQLRAASPSTPPLTRQAASSQVSRANRYARYEAVRALHQQALSEREIARRMHLSRETVHQFIVAETFPERSRPLYRGSRLDPYKPYMRERWQQGCWNGAQIAAEVKARGYTGADSLLRGFITGLRKHHQAAGTATNFTLNSADITPASPPHSAPKHRMSPTRASWLCVSQPTKLEAKQLRQVEQIRASHADLDKAYQISQAFVVMFAEQRGQDLDAWLIQAEQHGIPELKSFAQGIRRDLAAVRAAFTSLWNNGQVEAQVNCLKLQKRMVFGRANFDLLRLRVLARAS